MSETLHRLPPGLLIESIEMLEEVGCQFDFCDGPTLEPVDMVTCRRCDLLARLRIAAGRPPRRDDELTREEAWQKYNVAYMAKCTGRLEVPA